MSASRAIGTGVPPDPGAKPKKPSRPRKPKMVVIRTDEVWSSEQSDCTLADILNIIPNGVPADSIYISVEKYSNDKTVTTISYDREFPNTKYAEQLEEYEKKLKKHEKALKRWETRCKEWEEKKAAYDEYAKEIQRAIEDALSQHVA